MTLVLMIILVCSPVAFSQSTPQAFTGANIIPISGEPINNGVFIVQNGQIVTVGDADTDIPNNAEVHDVSGKVIMPGLVDTHSHVGEGDGGDYSSSLHPDVRIMDTIDPRSKEFRKVVSGGITSVNIMPGSGLLMSGQTVYLKPKPADTIEEMLIVNDETGIYGGLKMANGTNPLRENGSPGTRAKSAAMVRELFIKAQEYQQKIEDADGDPDEMPARDLQMETLVEVLEGKRMVHNHTHRHDDILTAIRLAEEFGYRLVLQHVSEAHRVADEIAESGAHASIINVDAPGGKLEAINLVNINGKALEDAGVNVGFHTDDPIVDSRFLLRSAAFGVRNGMSREAALEGLTIVGARMMDIEGRVGSLEEGKDADFIVLSGDPLSVYTHVEQTWIEGEKVYDRSNPEDRDYATGGYEIFRTTNMHIHGEGRKS